jgi:hypothetical protein
MNRVVRAAEVDIQCANALRVLRCGERFEYEVPFARNLLVGEEPSPFVLVARAPFMSPHPLAGIHRDVQGNGLTSFETHLDEASAVLLRCKDGGPHVGLVDKYRPPEPANVCQPRRPYTPSWVRGDATSRKVLRRISTGIL